MMVKCDDGFWQCTECGKTSRVKTNIYEHIESTHTDCPGYQCPLCQKFCRSRNALRAHKVREHGNQSSKHGPSLSAYY